MSTDLIYFPAEDVADSVAYAMKSVLVDMPEFRKQAPGFTATLAAGDTVISFPEVGVDFRTVTPTGIIGTWAPEVLVPEGVVARIRTTDPQPAGTVTIPTYDEYTTFFVGQVDDLPFDWFSYLGDPLSGVKQARTIPLGMAVVDTFRVARYAGRGEEARITGYFCIYAGASQGGRATVKTECGKLIRKLRGNQHIFGSVGIQNLLVRPPMYGIYAADAAITEGAIQFSCTVRLS